MRGSRNRRLAGSLFALGMDTPGLPENKFKLGADAAASAGPVGRNAQAGTDWKMNAELLTYSRSKGLFAGIDLDGTSVSQNQQDTEIYYGHPHGFDAILKGAVAPPGGSVEGSSRRAGRVAAAA